MACNTSQSTTASDCTGVCVMYRVSTDLRTACRPERLQQQRDTNQPPRPASPILLFSLQLLTHIVLIHLSSRLPSSLSLSLWSL